MNTYTDTRIITLHSKDAIKNNGTANSDVYFPFETIYSREEAIAYVDVSIRSAEIPSSFYTINETNNTFNFIYLSTTYPITLTEGNYNATQFNTEIIARVDEATSTSGLFTISISSTTGRLTITATNTIEFSKTNTLFWKLAGFDPTTSSLVVNAGTPQTLPYPINLLGINLISIQSNKIPTYSYTSGVGGLSNVLAVIDNYSSPYGLISYKDNQTTHHIIRSHELKNIDIHILDENENYVDFNGVEWTICLSINIHRYGVPQQTKTFQQHKEEIKENDAVKK